MDGAEYERRLGERLREIRRQQQLSLQDVEHRSGDEFRIASLGAYERGERSITVGRLQRLASLYGVPVSELLPRAALEPFVPELPLEEPQAPSGDVCIELAALDRLPSRDRPAVAGFLRMIRALRQDFNGRMLTIRGEDVRNLASVLGYSSEELLERLTGARARPA